MSNPSPADDWQLLEDSGDGPREIGLLFERHKDYVFRLACGFVGDRELAEDVTQDVFLRLADGRARGRPRARFRTWLYKVTLNTARELRRRQGREAGLLAEDEAEQRSMPPPQNALLADLERALGGLSERQREVVVLRFYEGLSTRETAQVMRCREGTVKSHLHRAFEFLRTYFNPGDEP